MGEHRVCNAGVVGSSPIDSIQSHTGRFNQGTLAVSITGRFNQEFAPQKATIIATPDDTSARPRIDAATMK